MNKSVTLWVVVLLIISFGWLLTLRPGMVNPTRPPSASREPSATAVPHPNETVPCRPQDLEKEMTFQDTAATINGYFTLTNTSSEPCTVAQQNYLEVVYDSRNITNVVVEHTGSPANVLYVLQPRTSLHAQVTYPNGSQCSSGTFEVAVSYTYAINSVEKIEFSNVEDAAETVLSICTNVEDQTIVKVSPFF